MKLREWIGGSLAASEHEWWAEVDDAMGAASLPNVEIAACYEQARDASSPYPVVLPGNSVVAFESEEWLAVRVQGKWTWLLLERFGRITWFSQFTERPAWHVEFKFGLRRCDDGKYRTYPAANQ